MADRVTIPVQEQTRHMLDEEAQRRAPRGSAIGFVDASLPHLANVDVLTLLPLFGDPPSVLPFRQFFF